MAECLYAWESQLGAARVSTLFNLYQRSLWHELTQELLCIQGDVLVPVFCDFVKSFQDKLNPMRLSELAIKVASYMKPDEALIFIESIQVKEPQAQMYLTIAKGAKMLDLGRVYESQAVLEDCQKQVEVLNDLENSLYSGLYQALARVHRMKNEDELFYRYSLQYLAYTPAEQVPNAQALAAELAVAVLVAESLYNLGELLELPVFVSLKSTPDAQLYDLILLCYEGKVQEFETALQSPSLPPALVSGREALLQKVRILAVMEMAFRRERGKLTFEEIAAVGCVPLAGVEWLLMKAMAKGLLRGEIDQVEGVVVFNYVQPRVLDRSRLEQIKGRIKTWQSTVGAVLRDLETNSKELID